MPDRDTRDALDTWEHNALRIDIEINDKIRVHPTRVECPWCWKKYLVAVRNEKLVSGIMVCSGQAGHGGCGEFFKWSVLNQEARTSRVLAHAAFRIDATIPGGEESWHESSQKRVPPSKPTQLQL